MMLRLYVFFWVWIFFLVFVSSFLSCFHRDFWLKGKTPVVSEEHSMSVTQEFNEKQSGFRVRPLRPNHTLTFFTLVSLHRRFHYYRYLWSFYLSLLKKKTVYPSLCFQWVFDSFSVLIRSRPLTVWGSRSSFYSVSSLFRFSPTCWELVKVNF